MPPPPVSRHLAYISYAEEDNRPPGRAWADWIKQTLETFPVPRNLVGRPTPVGPIPARLSPVIKRAQIEGTTLPAAMRQALEQSRLLIVVCSPVAARTAQVAEEIRYFKQLGRDRILAVIVTGEADASDPSHECFPETLKYEISREGTIDREWRVHPITIDARKSARGGQSDHLAQTRQLLAAAALGVPPEALPNEDDDELRAVSRARPGRARFATILVVLSLLIASGLGVFAYLAHEQQKAAEAARKRSDGVIVFLQRSLREKLEPIGQLGALAEINERITEHLGRVARETNDPIALSGLADAFRDCADILEQRGNHQAAVESAVQAVQTRQRVADGLDAPADTALRLIADLRAVAQIYMNMGQYREALAVAEQGRAAAVTLSRKRLGDQQVELALAQAQLQAGDALLELAKLEEAERAYTSARESTRQLAARLPHDVAIQQELAAATERFARLKERQGDTSSAIAELREWQRLLGVAATENSKSFQAQAALAAAQMRLGNVLLVQRQPQEAAREFRKAVDVLAPVVRAQPEDHAIQLNYVTALHRLAYSLAFDPAGQTEAAMIVQRALDHLDERFPGDSDPKASTTRAEVQRLRDSLAAKAQ
jgi:tetratricopeptide (TPR) repeat protein